MQNIFYYFDCLEYFRLVYLILNTDSFKEEVEFDKFEEIQCK